MMNKYIILVADLGDFVANYAPMFIENITYIENRTKCYATVKVDKDIAECVNGGKDDNILDIKHIAETKLPTSPKSTYLPSPKANKTPVPHSINVFDTAPKKYNEGIILSKVPSPTHPKWRLVLNQ